MDVMLSLGAAVLCVVFLTAGVRKLRDTTATATSMRGFGLPAEASNRLAPLLPWVELAVVVMLLLPGLAAIGVVSAVVLLSVFTLAIVTALLRGKRPACNCFGQASDQPISWFTAARNLVLLAVAIALLLQVQQMESGLIAMWANALRGMNAAAGAGLLLVALLAAQAWVVAKLFSQQGRMLLRIDNLEHDLAQRGRASQSHAMPAAGLAMGALAPDFEFIPVAGGAAQAMAHRLATQQEAVLIFVNPDCSPCHEVLDWLLHRPDSASAVVITSGSPEHNRRMRKSYKNLDIVIQSGQEAQDRYGVIGTPSAVRVRDGRIASGFAIGLTPIQSLFAPTNASGLQAGVAGAPRLA